MIWRLVVGIAGVALAWLAAIAPAAAQFRVCNKSGETVEVAFGYNGSGNTGWIAEGWYRIRPGGCATVHAVPLNGRYYYVYADGGGGSGWSGESGAPAASFCVSRKQFKLFQSRYGSTNEAAECAKHQLESRRFFRVDTGEHRQWVQNLVTSRGGPVQASPPAPPPRSTSAPPPSQPPPSQSPPSQAPPSQPPPKGSACERFPNLC